jgi:anthranilate synthase/aminodeoxychorismate synthase-like glutamine amidotransferase
MVRHRAIFRVVGRAHLEGDVWFNGMSILLIDNYDSFVHNLARYLQRLGQTTHVVRNDTIDAEAVRRLPVSAIVISPGPCTPREAGVSVDVVRACHGARPILGVCLGHQVIAEAYGGCVRRTENCMHGQASQIHHDGRAEFTGMPVPFVAGRYHSLAVQPESLPSDLEVSAWTKDGVVMGIRARTEAVFGWQFHPESILTPLGLTLLAGFLRASGLAVHTHAVEQAPSAS